MKISVEVFNAVKNCDISKDKDMQGVYSRLNDNKSAIDTFVFECLEWLWNKKNFTTSIQYNGLDSGYVTIESIDGEIYQELTGKSTQDALFHACEYVIGLNNER